VHVFGHCVKASCEVVQLTSRLCANNQSVPRIILWVPMAVTRVPHSSRFTHGFQAMGHTVTVTVTDFDTRRQTVPFTAMSRYCTYTVSGPGSNDDGEQQGYITLKSQDMLQYPRLHLPHCSHPSLHHSAISILTSLILFGTHS
jgi:hypothetical protein